MTIEENSQVEALSSKVEQVSLGKTTKPNKYQSLEEYKAHMQLQSKLLREKQKPYLALRKLNLNHEKVYNLINMFNASKQVLHCIENLELYQKFINDLKYQ